MLPPRPVASPDARTRATRDAGGPRDPAATTEVDDPAAAPTLPSDDGPAAGSGLPSTVGRFEVIGKLGEGGMGVVLEARDPRLDRRIAVKLVRVATPAARARLVREAQAMARVAHPNVVAIHEAGVFDDEVFVAMELVAGGRTLGAWLGAEPRSWRDVVRAYVEAGKGLVAVHAAGLVHRDFKPDNVLVGRDGRPRVVDFGLARGASEAVEEADDPHTSGTRQVDVRLTRAGAILGTPSTMAPEQWRGEDAGPPADQFAFAVSLYRALWQRPPFEGESVPALREAVIEGRLLPPPPTTDVPRAVVDAVVRGLAPEPEARWPTLRALVEDLELELARDPDADPGLERNARRLVPAALLAAGALSVVLLGKRLPSLSVRDLTIQAGIGTAAIAIAVFVFRRRLAATRVNRRVAAMFLTAATGVLLHRLVSLTTDVAPHHVLMGDAMTMATIMAFGAFVIERWLAWCAALAVVAAIGCSFGMEVAPRVFPATLILFATVPIVLWRERPAPARAPAGGATSRPGTSSSGGSS